MVVSVYNEELSLNNFYEATVDVLEKCTRYLRGYTTMIVVLCLLFAVTLVVIGIIGQYISILFAEVKDRPIYIVRNVLSDNNNN